MKQLLNVTSLKVHYGPVEAIKGISFHVNEGELVSLIGSNGAGKTTTLMALSGVIPSSGGIEFCGENIAGLRSDKVFNKGLVHCPEGRGIFGNLTVSENLQLGFSMHSKDRSKNLEHVLNLFPRLRERLKQKAGTLSGGEQQMLAIARSYLARPKLLVLDEPSLGLAPKIVEQIFSLIQTLHKEGISILLVEQNAHKALQISERVYVLETGKVVLQGESKQLLGDPHVQAAYLGGL